MSDVLASDSVHCAGQRQHSIPDFFTKTIDNTQQNVCWRSKWVPAGVQYRRRRKKIFFFVVCINVKKQVIQCFCVHLFSPTNFFEKIDNDTFAIIRTQPSNMQGEHWIMTGNFRHELYFAVSLWCKGYSFLSNQHYKQMMPDPLQSHPSVCGFYTIYAAFHLFKFRLEKITGVHDVNVLCFISNYM